MDPRADDLIKQGNELFTKRLPLLSLWQEQAENFYPERADFTAGRSIGTDFASNLMTSYPLLARRELGGQISAMLRPTAKEWFHTKTNHDALDEPGRAWLEWCEGTMRRAMYARQTQFTRATKEGDHDFAAFGQCGISVELNRAGNDLLYRCWHLRDLAWSESVEGKVDTFHLKWKPTARQLCKMFGGNVHPDVARLAEKEPYHAVEVRHIVIPADNYEPPVGKKRPRSAYVALYIDVDNQHVMEEVGSRTPIYVVPRWQTVSGSQYAFSPATVAALPDARLIQAMMLTLLEAGEKAVNPPLIGTQEAIRSDVAVYAGGITWVDAEYDEKLGEALRPMALDIRGIPTGLEMIKDTREMIAQAFYLNKLTMPTAGEGPEQTAYEVGQRIQEYIRGALPLFEPMEMEYNGGICDATFDILLHNGAFGSVRDMPQSLKGQEIQFRFESPLNEAIEAQKGQKLGMAKALLAQVADLDPTLPAMLDGKAALRDALRGIGTPAKWMRTEKQMDAIQQQHDQQQQIQQTLATLQAGAGVVKTLGDAGQSVGAAMTPPQGAQPASVAA